MRLAFVGCGYVADFYIKTLPYHPELELVGVYDWNPQRLAHFSNFYSVEVYDSLEALLTDDRVEIVVNLTNPESHYEVTKASLMAGKHVYTEKPLALTFDEAEDLVELAKQLGLYISSAPCSLYGDSAQTLWKALRHNIIGNVYLAYAELDDGMTHRLGYQNWVSKSGTPWPYKNEFETGCTIEHAGYYLTWLTAFFGPAKVVTSFSSCLIPNKTKGVSPEAMAPDFSVGCIEFSSGIVARITCSIVAEVDRGLKIIGDEGTLSIKDCWNYRSPVYLEKRQGRQSWIWKKIPILSRLLRDYAKPTYPLLSNPNRAHNQQNQLDIMDYGYGIAELADAIQENRPCRISADHALHVTEITLSLQHPQEMGSPRKMKSTFTPITPLPWAES